MKAGEPYVRPERMWIETGDPALFLFEFADNMSVAAMLLEIHCTNEFGFLFGVYLSRI